MVEVVVLPSRAAPKDIYALKAIHRKAQGVNEVTRFITVRAGEVVSADFTIEATAK